MVSHEDLCEFLRGRFYVSPAKLYSVARPSKHRQEYEVPIEGEWVTIAVVAERGEVKVSYRGASHADDDNDQSETNRRNGPKKYITIRLVDLGGASADGKGKAVRGDAHLNMILFEADLVKASREKSSRGVERSYKGGSGGAFEHSSSFPEGTVIAICTPKVLKPYQVCICHIFKVRPNKASR
jgi:minichromosome maintenance protein 10